jgi:hypothetical protein
MPQGLLKHLRAKPSAEMKNLATERETFDSGSILLALKLFKN